MEPIRRKFKSDISSTAIDKLIEKRQRKTRYLANKKTPYGFADESNQQQATPSPTVHRVNMTLIDSIPAERLPSYQKIKCQRPKPETVIPDRWKLQTKKERVSKDVSFELESAKIRKNVDYEATYSRSARAFINARGQKLAKPSDRITAKGYLSNRSDNQSETVKGVTVEQ